MDVGCVFGRLPLSSKRGSLEVIDSTLGEVGLAFGMKAGRRFHQSCICESWGTIVGGLEMGER